MLGQQIRQQTLKKQEVKEDLTALPAEDIESDHHGQDYIDYHQPPYQAPAIVWDFTNEVKIAQGTFGEVFMSTIVSTKQVVAVKRLIQNKKVKNRELQILKEMHHQNIIRTLHGFFTLDFAANGLRETKLNIVMDFIPGTVARIQREFKKLDQKVHPLLTKLYMYQLMRGLNYIHKKGIVHRDIKPQNLLVDPSCHVLKICDFGSAKKLQEGETSTSYICCRYYRAPELIYGQKDYQSEIDLWSAGCVLAELLLGQPLFAGEDNQAILAEIMKVLGSPDKDLIQRLNPNHKKKIPQVLPQPWKKIISAAPLHSLDFLTRLLAWDPKHRIGGVEILKHPYFDELREEGLLFPNGNCLPDVLNLTFFELGEDVDQQTIDILVPSWYQKQRGIYYDAVKRRIVPRQVQK